MSDSAYRCLLKKDDSYTILFLGFIFFMLFIGIFPPYRLARFALYLAFLFSFCVYCISRAKDNAVYNDLSNFRSNVLFFISGLKYFINSFEYKKSEYSSIPHDFESYIISRLDELSPASMKKSPLSFTGASYSAYMSKDAAAFVFFSMLEYKEARYDDDCYYLDMYRYAADQIIRRHLYHSDLDFLIRRYLPAKTMQSYRPYLEKFCDIYTCYEYDQEIENESKVM